MCSVDVEPVGEMTADDLDDLEARMVDVAAREATSFWLGVAWEGYG